MLKIYNTLTKQKEEFNPIEPGKVSIYQCGPTVYWTQHIGNMRSMVVTDILIRTLKNLGLKTEFARNYTDVGHLTSDSDEGEDKMSKSAQKEGLTPKDIADKYIKIFENDARLLNITQPEFKPRATDYIQEMIDMVDVLVKKGFAYTTPLAIYFDTSKASDYNRLSGQIIEENISEAGHGKVSDPNKQNPSDFAIWFFKAGVHENAIQTWKNPFSDKEGFPGWHMECSAMIKKLLGETIDIHLGGIEHIPVHHTNEIAQSESANGKSFVNYWMHYEHLLVNNGKMSKSEGTGYSLSQITEKGFDPLSLRYFFLGSHYRSKQNFTWEALQDAENSYFKLIGKISEMLKTSNQIDLKNISPEYDVKFIESIYNDLNTPEALAVVYELLKDTSVDSVIKINTLAKFDQILGLSLIEKASDKIEAEQNIPAEVIILTEKRDLARKNKDWESSDKIRNEILGLGYDIKDTEDGSVLSKIN